MSDYYLLGPQRPTVNLNMPFDTMNDDRPVAVVSAGWQQAEGDIDDVRAIVDRNLVDLQLYQRAEDVLAGESLLADAHRERQDRLQELQRLYRIRLSPSIQAAQKLLEDDGDPQILHQEQRHAIMQLRALDRYHLRRIQDIHNDVGSKLAGQHLPKLEEHCADIENELSDCTTIVVTGGNVAVLLNRLRLFNLASAMLSRNLVAWSAGAMVLADKVVLFHDNTPQGDRDAEVFDVGLGLVSGSVFLPDASRRLRLDDKNRLALFSRRFAPAACLTLDSGSILKYRDRRLVMADRNRRISRNGTLRRARVQ